MKMSLRWCPITDSCRARRQRRAICPSRLEFDETQGLCRYSACRGRTAPAASPSPGFRPDSRDVAPGFLFFALPGSKADGAAYAADAARRGAAAIVAGNGARLAARHGAGDRSRRSAAGAGAGRGALLRQAARHDGRRHRHQRQDVGRLLHPADLGAGRQGGGQHRHDRRRRARPQRIWRADDARSGGAAPPARANSPTTASRTPRWKPRATASTSAGSTA